MLHAHSNNQFDLPEALTRKGARILSKSECREKNYCDVISNSSKLNTCLKCAPHELERICHTCSNALSMAKIAPLPSFCG